MAAARNPVVVKLGGSFAHSAHLRDWVAALADCAGRAVIVPGGGPFADTVRVAQARIGFDDKAAHAMAILAMEQYGHALLSLNGALSPGDSVDAVRHGLAAGRVPVWLPARMTLGEVELAPSWEVTSDSLAAWLLGKIGAERLFLVKHVAMPPGRARVADMVAAGIVDSQFGRHLQASGGEAFIFGPADYGLAAEAIRAGTVAGVAVAGGAADAPAMG